MRRHDTVCEVGILLESFTMHNIQVGPPKFGPPKFGPRKTRRVAVVLLGSMFWGASVCAAQGTQEASSADANGPSMMLADQTARVAAALGAQTPAQPLSLIHI